MNHGARNLAILGFAVILFAIITTTISLTIYHNSGDIYLDRSRPGFLPDKDEEAVPTEETYRLSETGTLTVEEIDEYSDHYAEEIKNLDHYKNAFDPYKLSDENLGISD